MSQKSTDMERLSEVNLSTMNVTFTVKAPLLDILRKFYADFEEFMTNHEDVAIERLRMDYVEGEDIHHYFSSEASTQSEPLLVKQGGG